MIIFLTSSPTGPLDGSRKVEGLDKKNHFHENVKKYWKKHAKCLIISAFPDDDDANDEMRVFFEKTLEDEKLDYESVDIWDRRTVDFSKEALHSYNVIFLGGGHVPTENAFFHKIALREKMKDYKGMVIGISAGTMNSAEEVYAQPELPGEAADSDYVRFLKGLGLTKTQILPHYQMMKDSVLDGMRVYEEITYSDSMGRRFLVLPDGSYLLIENGKETVYGEAWQIADGKMKKICEEKETFVWRA